MLVTRDVRKRKEKKEKKKENRTGLTKNGRPRPSETEWREAARWNGEEEPGGMEETRQERKDQEEKARIPRKRRKDANV